jgi:TatA/E family protein of Tat protein translocase
MKTGGITVGFLVCCRYVFYYFCKIDLLLMQVPVLLFFDISAGELIIILLVAFVVFGPSRIPEIARKIGRGLNEVRRASDEIKREITKETSKVEKSLSVDDLDFTKNNPVKNKEKEKPLEKPKETGQTSKEVDKNDPDPPKSTEPEK